MLPAVAVLAAVVVVEPRVLLAVPAAAALMLLIRPWGRFIWFIAGALAVLQSDSGGLSVSKGVYLSGLLASVTIAAWRLQRDRKMSTVQRLRPALLGAGLLGGYLLVVTAAQSLVVAGVPVVAWGRDVVTHLLLPCGVVLAADAARTLTYRVSQFLVLTFGAVAAYGFAAYWLDRRTAGAVADQLLLSSMAALVVPFAVAVALATARREVSLRWLVYAAGLLGSVLITGTRTGVVFLVAPFAMLGRRGVGAVPPRRLLGLGLAGVPVAALLIRFSSGDLAFLVGRWRDTLAVLRGGLAVDRSAVIRTRAYEYAYEIFTEHPLLGRGFGHVFPNPNPGGAARDFTLDTPVVYLAKWGVLGTAVLLISLALVLWTCWEVGRHSSLPTARAPFGALVVWLVSLPFGAPSEDKGFAISVALLVLLAGASVGQPREMPSDSEEATSPRLGGASRMPRPSMFTSSTSVGPSEQPGVPADARARVMTAVRV